MLSVLLNWSTITLIRLKRYGFDKHVKVAAAFASAPNFFVANISLIPATKMPNNKLIFIDTRDYHKNSKPDKPLLPLPAPIRKDIKTGHYESIVDIIHPESLKGFPVRRLALYTKRPAIGLPTLRIKHDGIKLKIRVTTIGALSPIKNPTTCRLVERYTEIIKKTFDKTSSDNQNFEYLVAPLRASSNARATGSNWIDRKEMKKALENGMEEGMPLNKAKIHDAILFRNDNHDALFYVQQGLSQTMSRILAAAVTNKGDLFTSLSNENVTDHNAMSMLILLDPVTVRAYPVSASVYQALQVLPEVINRLNMFWSVKDFKSRTKKASNSFKPQ
ncbi:hypothetical protein BCV72DRAFT_301516 [Rhizopus microsporus var. microsporus]|uniref:Uncharacterized protein n=2 Tax=Rhizopus microsporus TaxID=58291 RepID=A0A2G4SK76_RHIZD|nr:uncharacterized protein RHIMIDRAFT_246455 [Rhizopus microsporus ATCC 52813]ORE10763.1 hypothetical protein BCV72DRAFT_301516 [Rhizopus microsporus var. microsporus]PHZ09171.1 hypothetical protein RHIMIDRAFT_246455 [Rhizopus microsporus ATCC 52813]